MKAEVDKELCIGCSVCADSCPDVFRMEDDDRAFAFADPVPSDQEDCAKQAAEDCPVEAISVK